MPVEYSGNLVGKGKNFAIVIGRFNEFITKSLLDGALDCLYRHGVEEKDIRIYWVPGSFELPQVARKVAGTDVSAVICLGALIRGDTYHFEVVSNESARAITELNLIGEIPLINGVLTCYNAEQAQNRVKLGAEYAKVAIQMIQN